MKPASPESEEAPPRKKCKVSGNSMNSSDAEHVHYNAIQGEDKKENFELMSKEELISKIRAMELHIKQLRNIIAKSSGTAKRKPVNRKHREFNHDKYRRRHILMRFCYLGWDYQGLASQEDTAQTIEAELFRCLQLTRLVRDRQTANYHRCGRTDKGVSAFSQVISLDVRSQQLVDPRDPSALADLPPEQEINYPSFLNKVLPAEIRVLCWSPAAPEASARFDCRARTYRYFFPRGDLNLQAMRDAAGRLCGHHDFRNLCKMDVGNGVVGYRRRLERVAITTLDGPAPDRYSGTRDGQDRDRGSGTRDGPAPNRDSGTRDGQDRDSGTRDGPDRDSGTRDGPAPDRDSGTRDDPDRDSGSGTRDGPAPDRDSGTRDGPDSGTQDGPDRDSGTRDGPAPDRANGGVGDASEYQMCQLEVRGNAFLWHQIRCMVAVLFLVGEGLEEPSVIDQLLDVESNPRKPQYSMASELPLNLFDVEYDSVRWHCDPAVLRAVMETLQRLWTQSAVRSAMLRAMLGELTAQHGIQVASQPACLTTGVRPRVHTRLLQRPTCDSLEERVGHYVKRRKLSPAILENVSSSAAAAAGPAVSVGGTEPVPGAVGSRGAAGREAGDGGGSRGARQTVDGGSGARPDVGGRGAAGQAAESAGDAAIGDGGGSGAVPSGDNGSEGD